MATSVLDNGSVLPSQGRAAVRLVPKIDRPATLSEYRPISVLNTDYKLIASVLARRLRTTLPSKIQMHQRGGVPGRYIFDSLCLYRDVIEDAAQRADVPAFCPHTHRRRDRFGAAIVAFDFEKAYDLVNREVLWETMRVMGFPDLFITWLKGLYSITTLCPLNGSALVGEIHNVGSLRQGCPLSVHLFVLFIEPLLVALDSNLEGILLHGHKVAVRGFVDDLAVFVRSDRDILRACEIVERFCAWTKMRVNKSKCKLLGIGDWSFELQTERKNANLASGTFGNKTPVKIWPVEWLKPVKSLKLLGIDFTANLK